jgi:coenzyme F420-reducing hydrogenase alpha subunit
MSKKIILNKATRIEGNANIHIEIEDGRINAARFMVHDFRGFEKFLQGRRVEFVPHLISRICGLCSVSHQVASLKAIEDALGVDVPQSLGNLRQIAVLGEWINSHALSYFFLAMPDFVGAAGGVFELIGSHPDITSEAFALRKAGQQIVTILGKRAVHPVAFGVGRFLISPTADDLNEIRKVAGEVKERTARLITKTGKTHLRRKSIGFPPDQQINLLTYGWKQGMDVFKVYNKTDDAIISFPRRKFDENISEMHAEWTFAKFPYLTHFGFPAGIMLVGPLSRGYMEGGLLDESELAEFELTNKLSRGTISLEDYDTCRLLEIFWAAKTIINLLDEVELSNINAEVDFRVSGQGIGVIEAPRGALVHSYLINRGCIERIRLLVATQFNNAFINLLIRDLAERHLKGNKISREGERLIGRCIRIFDPCLSCATH